VTATARASIGLYNDERDIDTLIEGLNHVGTVFG
jgi:selenocysteine lyase/cysteine desulfurase